MHITTNNRMKRKCPGRGSSPTSSPSTRPSTPAAWAGAGTWRSRCWGACDTAGRTPSFAEFTTSIFLPITFRRLSLRISSDVLPENIFPIIIESPIYPKAYFPLSRLPEAGPHGGDVQRGAQRLRAGPALAGGLAALRRDAARRRLLSRLLTSVIDYISMLIYIYIYIYVERERDRERERLLKCIHINYAIELHICMSNMNMY